MILIRTKRNQTIRNQLVFKRKIFITIFWGKLGTGGLHVSQQNCVNVWSATGDLNSSNVVAQNH